MLSLARDALVFVIILEVVGGIAGLVIAGILANRRLRATRARRHESPASDESLT